MQIGKNRGETKLFDLTSKYETLVNHKRALGDSARAYFYYEAPKYLFLQEDTAPDSSLDSIERNASPLPDIATAKRIIKMSSTSAGSSPWIRNTGSYHRHLGRILQYRISGSDLMLAATAIAHTLRNMRGSSGFYTIGGTLYVPEHNITIAQGRSVGISTDQQPTINNLYLSSRDRSRWQVDILREGCTDEEQPPKYQLIIIRTSALNYPIWCEGPFCTAGAFDLSIVAVKSSFDGDYIIRIALLITCMDSTIVYMGGISVRSNKPHMARGMENLHRDLNSVASVMER